MVLAAPPIRKLHVGGRSRRRASFSLRKHPISPSLHRGLSPVGYDFALVNGDELVSYTLQKPRHAPVRFYTHANHLYSIAAITNTAGAVVERYSYNAYGVRTVKNSAGATLAKSAVNQDRGFTGYKLDSETGLYFARARMYSAKLGRFIARDMVRASKTGPDGLQYIGLPRSGENYMVAFGLYNADFVPNQMDPSGNATLTVKKCEVHIFFGHNVGSKPHTWNFKDPGCAVGVFVGCNPGSVNGTNPPGTSFPDPPMHDHNTVYVPPRPNDGSVMDQLNDNTRERNGLNDDPSYDYLAEIERMKAQARAKAPDLCKCCKEVKIIWESVGSIKDIINPFDLPVPSSGSETFSCP